MFTLSNYLPLRFNVRLSASPASRGGGTTARAVLRRLLALDRIQDPGKCELALCERGYCESMPTHLPYLPPHAIPTDSREPRDVAENGSGLRMGRSLPVTWMCRSLWGQGREVGEGACLRVSMGRGLLVTWMCRFLRGQVWGGAQRAEV